MQRLRSVARWVLVVLAVVVGAIGGLAALLGTAVTTPTPPVFLGVGLVAFVAITFGGVNLVTRRLGQKRRGVVRVAVTAASTLLLLAGSVFVLLPLHDPVIPPTPVPGQAFWELPTGSRIAHVKVPATGPRRPDPIVFLHGGPGVADMAGAAAYFGQLARDGFDVWVYDQVGVGRSARLHDPTAYTVGRDVADLEAIRQRIGAERLILIGYSYGSTVAAAYLAQHPDHVERVVFSSPGPIRWRGYAGGVLFARLDPSRRRQLYAAVLRPRVFLAWLLVQVDPKAAHTFAGDQELDRRFDLLSNLAAPGLFCDTRAPRPPLGGLGAYANLVPQALRAPAGPDPRPALGRLRTPALIIKGSCDYLSWSSALDYRATMPTARLVYLRGAGHLAHGDQPASYLAVVRAFLTGKQLPIAPYVGDAVPRDYEGPK